MLTAIASCFMLPGATHTNISRQDRIRKIVDQTIMPLMTKYKIHGVSVGVTLGSSHFIINYGVQSIATKAPISDKTLFEIGSVTKTFTATLAAYAAETGRLFLADKTSKHLKALLETRFGKITLLELGTHTTGGFPLQVPEYVTNDNQLLRYLKQWRPAYPPGTYRTYANPSVGMLGVIAAKSMKLDFIALLEKWLFPTLDMNCSFIDVPESKISDYAQGYTKEDVPTRMTPGILSAETYGVKSTAADLVRFMDANMSGTTLPPKLQAAITKTHTAYFKLGPMSQDLIWEQYSYPVALKSLLAGNSPTTIFEPMHVEQISPPEIPRTDVWINKTGSTNGFATYIAFIPKKKMGIVILANKSYPIEDRVTAAYKILTQLATQ